MSTGVGQFDALLDELHFVVVDQDTVMGDVQGIPTTLTLLSADPPAIMFQFHVNPD
jgi:hypothetical protein